MTEKFEVSSEGPSLEVTSGSLVEGLISRNLSFTSLKMGNFVFLKAD